MKTTQETAWPAFAREAVRAARAAARPVTPVFAWPPARPDRSRHDVSFLVALDASRGAVSAAFPDVPGGPFAGRASRVAVTARFTLDEGWAVAAGRVIGVPTPTPRPADAATRRRVAAAVRAARRDGAVTVGFDRALTRWVPPPLGVERGAAFRSALLYRLLEDACARRPGTPTVAIVGASDGVERTLAWLVARHLPARVLIVDADAARASTLLEHVRPFTRRARASMRPTDVWNADAAVVLDAGGLEALTFARPDAFVLNDSGEASARVWTQARVHVPAVRARTLRVEGSEARPTHVSADLAAALHAPLAPLDLTPHGRAEALLASPAWRAPHGLAAAAVLDATAHGARSLRPSR